MKQNKTKSGLMKKKCLVWLYHTKTITILLRIRVRGYFVMSITMNHESHVSHLLYYWLKTWFYIDFLEANQGQKTCRCDRHVEGLYCNPKNFTCVTRGACIVFWNHLQNGSHVQKRSCSTDTSSKFICGDPTRVRCCYFDMCNADIHLPLPSPTSGTAGGKVFLCSFSVVLRPNPWI